jgi:hypothetical protein
MHRRKEESLSISIRGGAVCIALDHHYICVSDDYDNLLTALALGVLDTTFFVQMCLTMLRQAV